MSAGWAIAARANKTAPKQPAQAARRPSASTTPKKRVATMSRNRSAKPCGPMVCEEDKGWRAESDLRTLAEAERIKSDKTRLTLAQSKAIEQAKAAEANLKLVASNGVAS